MVGVIFISFYFHVWKHPATQWIMSWLQGHVAEFGSVIEVFLQQF